MIYIQQFVELLELALAKSNVSLSVVGGIVAIAAGLHLWTQHVHKTSKSPNWTLLQLCNALSLVVFFASLAQLFRWSGSGRAPSPSDFVWGVLCLFCVVYFFSIFGVWFVHSLLLDDALGPDEEADLASPDEATGDSSRRLRASSLDVHGRRFATLGEGINAPSTHGRGATLEPQDLMAHQRGGFEALQPGGGSRSGAAALDTTSAGDAAAALVQLQEVLTRDLQLAASRLGKARDGDDAWGVLELLWRATNSGRLSVDLLRQTHVGRCLGNFCRRTCGRCALPDCEWCEVIAAWKGLAWSEITNRSQQERDATASAAAASHASPPGGLPPVGPSGRRHRRPASPHSQPRSHALATSLPPIPERRERTGSSESSTSEVEPAPPPRRPADPRRQVGTEAGDEPRSRDTSAAAVAAAAAIAARRELRSGATSAPGAKEEGRRGGAVSVVSSASATCVPLALASLEQPLAAPPGPAAAPRSKSAPALLYARAS